MAKFKVGDKVRIKNVNGIMFGHRSWKNGDTSEVTDIDDDGDIYVRMTKREGALLITNNEFECIEKLPSDPTKNERIESLEKQVAELQAEVKVLMIKSSEINILQARVSELEKAQQPKYPLDEMLAKTPNQASANEQRKAIIDEAKAFVEDVTKRMSRYGHGNKLGEHGEITTSARGWVTKAEFIVNAKKRTVVALARGIDSGKIYAKGIAKCAPDDVFNADIGKAIALGRALGLDVSKFEQAVQPTEVVVGQVVENYYEGVHKVFAVLPTHRTYGEGKGGKFSDLFNEGYTYINKSNLEYWSRLSKIKRIINDTEAQYV